MHNFSEAIVESPLGEVTLSVAADDALRVRWLVRRLAGFRGTTDEFGLRVGIEAQWAGLVSFSAVAKSEPLEARVSLPMGQRGEWSNGECLACRQFTQGELELFVAGGDVDFYAREVVAGRLPARWRDQIRLDQPDNRFGVVDWLAEFDPDFCSALPTGENGVGWKLPALEAGETAQVHFTVAWSRGHLAASAGRLAVDRDPAEAEPHQSAPSEQRRYGRAAPLHSKYRK